MGAPNEINEPEFQQARAEVYDSLTPLFEKQPELKDIFEVIQIPERVIQFRVVWEDDKGKLNVNTGFRVQFNSALGPYKGGLRLHPSVTLSILKFLGFEQTFKNALTGLNMGGGKGGSDFDPKGKTDNEIRRFCVAFATELSRHIGPNTDVPAGDIGFSTREAGFLFGQYKKLRNEWGGMITGKGASWGGSEIRPEATGYGLIYFVQCMIKESEGTSDLEATFKGKTVAISGSGNVAQYAALKAMELGAKVVSLSDSKGSLIAKGDKTFTPEDVYKIQALKAKHGYLADSGLSHFECLDGKRPWEQFEKLDIALPCATQNEVSGEEATALVKAGVKYVAEGSNMGSTKEAIDVFEEARESDVWYVCGKASNCGGVAVSGLEMAQNSQRITWSSEEVDAKLKKIMMDCYQLCFDTSKQYPTSKTRLPSLVQGSNIAGFLKVAEAMIAHGDVWVSK